MNPKAEFIKAIMSVLRLEPNVYINGAIETIIDRLDTKDYQLFIAYLGERESSFEKPIDSIARGVEEFYNIKLEPFKTRAVQVATNLYLALNEIKRNASEYSEKNIHSEESKQKIENKLKEYSEQNDIARENKRLQIELELSKELRNHFLNYTINKCSEFLSGFIYSKNKERVISEEDEEVLKSIGGFKRLLDSKSEYAPKYIIKDIEEFLLKDFYKPSIAEKIYLTESKSDEIKSIEVRDKIKLLATAKQEAEGDGNPYGY